MPDTRKPKRRPANPATASRRLETRSAGPSVLVVRSGRRLLLPHERDEAAIPEPRKLVSRNRKLIRQGARDVEHGLIDTEARGIPTNIPTTRRRPGAQRAKRRPE